MAFFTAKVPITIATGIICLMIGGGVGAGVMSYLQGDPKSNADASNPDSAKDGMKAPDPKDGMGGKGGKGGGAGGKGGGAIGGGKGGGKGGGGFAPSPKAQLAQLVTKLDTLTGQTLHIDLTPEQKKQAKELLAGLAEKDEIKDEDAKEKLDALLKILEPHKKALEDAGFRWPGGMGGGGPPGGMPPANPFKEGDSAAALKALEAKLGK